MKTGLRLDVSIHPFWFAIATEWHRRDLVDANDAKDREDVIDDLERDRWRMTGPHTEP